MQPTKSYIEPPRWFFKFCRFFLKESYAEELEGDMEERFHDNVDHYGVTKARWLYRLDTLKLLRPSLVKRLGGDYYLNHYGMMMNNFKIALRQMRKQKAFSAIKIGGFSVGIAACILIAMYVNHQVSYDQHYADGDRIFRLANRWSEGGEIGYWTSVQGPLKEVLEDNIPEMDLVARLVTWPWGNAGDNHVRTTESTFNTYEDGFVYADPELLQILEVPMVFGSQKSALSQPNSMVISKSKAQIYFPNENPVGKQIILNNDPQSYVIGGVMEDFPSNSHLQCDFILTLFGRKSGPGTSGWCCTNYAMYVKLSPHADKLAVEEKTGVLRNSHVIEKLREVEVSGLQEMQLYQSYYLQPVKNIYLNPEKVGDYLSHGILELVWVFGFIAIIILLLACINFVNLSVANSLSRAKEVGLLKVVGSLRSGLIMRYLSESCLYSLLAVLLGAALAALALPYFNHMADTALIMPWNSAGFLLLLLGTSLTIGVLSGIYPALVLSGFMPIQALKGQVSSRGSSVLQRILVVIQFTATIVLIVSALVLHNQFDFIMDKPLGYEKDHVVNILGLDTMEGKKRQAFKKELIQLFAVKNASLSDFIPVEGSLIQNRSFWNQGRRQLDNGMEAARWVVDEDYLAAMGIKLKTGRNFSPELSDNQSIIINEQMRSALNLEEPIGSRVIDMFDLEYTIIGVVEDFYFESALGHVRPLCMVKGNGMSTLSVKVSGTDTPAALSMITDLWDSFSPNQAIRYSFMDQQFESMYDDLHRAKTIFMLFSVLSILIACSGLFALSLHMANRRSKEISVRKVLGASVGRILVSLTFGFFRLIIVAMIIAFPIASYFAEYMLEEFANRIAVSWDMFVLGGAIATLIALGTISFEAIKAALSNPAHQLRHE